LEPNKRSQVLISIDMLQVNAVASIHVMNLDNSLDFSPQRDVLGHGNSGEGDPRPMFDPLRAGREGGSPRGEGGSFTKTGAGGGGSVPPGGRGYKYMYL
jgi:hypothetical protein